MGGPDWNVSMVDIHLRKLLWVYCPEYAGVKGNDRAKRLAGKASLTSGLLLGRSEVLRSLRHYLQAQSQGHQPLIAWRRSVERRSTRQSSLKGREGAIVSQTIIVAVSKATPEKRPEVTGGHNYRLFRVHRYHIELSITLN